MNASATMASHLIKSGWQLHLNSNREKLPAIWKTIKEGDTATVESHPVSHDDVLELHEAGAIRRCESFEIGSETVTVFRYAG